MFQCGAVRFSCEESCHRSSVLHEFREERLYEKILACGLSRDIISNESRVLNSELQLAAMVCDSTRCGSSGLVNFPGQGYTMLYLAGSPVVHRIGSPGFFLVDTVSEVIVRKDVH